MKVLLAKENRGTKIGPILTICFTNHALDQFLEVKELPVIFILIIQKKNKIIIIVLTFTFHLFFFSAFT
jgi:hypothetical protein